MTLVIGTDEAGYGPNLGPLVISASVWRIPDRKAVEDFPALVAPTIVLGDTRESTSDSIRIADSKLLYHPGGSLRNLELPCLALAVLQGQGDSTTEFTSEISHDAYWRLISSDHYADLQAEFWWTGSQQPWPVSIDWSEAMAAASAIDQQLTSSNVEFVTMRSTTIVPERFNEAIQRLGNKAQVLTQFTLRLIASLLEDHEDERAIVICDRHGGRTRYRDALQEAIPDELIQVWHESSDLSEYRWGAASRLRECWFMTGGERHLPVAIASMTSKYLREVAMLAFNNFWTQHLPGIKRTAGYPTDAKRFRKDVESIRQQLHIDLNQFWRCR